MGDCLGKISNKPEPTEVILNDDVLINILNMLNPKELFQLQRVSKQFQYCCQQSLEKVKVLRIRSQLMTDDECYTRNTLDINGLKIHFIDFQWLAKQLLNIKVLVISPNLTIEALEIIGQKCLQIESLCFGPKFVDSLTDDKLMTILDIYGDRLNRFRMYCPDILDTNDRKNGYKKSDKMDILFDLMFEIFESGDNPYIKYTKQDLIDQYINGDNVYMLMSSADDPDYNFFIIEVAMNEISRRLCRYYPCSKSRNWYWTISSGMMYRSSSSKISVPISCRLGDLYQLWTRF